MPNKNLASALGVDEIPFSATFFSGKFSTLPLKESINVSFSELMEIIAPEEPQVNTDKDKLTYFVGCGLQDALFVGKTLEKAIKEGGTTSGKQRSSNHVTAGKVIKLDLDGITSPELKALLLNLKALDLAYAIYTTFSHGDKPNIRARLILAFDRNLQPTEYKAAVLALSKALLGESLDESEALLSQQASIYCAHPVRKHWAIRRVQARGKCISADYLLSLVPATTLKVCAQSSIANNEVIPMDMEKLQDAFRWIDPNSYNEWIKVATCLKALEPSLTSIESELNMGPDLALKLWLLFSEQACDEKKVRNEQRQYDPMVMFDQLKPNMTADAAMGTLMGIAKRRSLEIAKTENLTTGDNSALSTEGYAAIKHLRKYHPREIQLLIENSFCKEYV